MNWWRMREQDNFFYSEKWPKDVTLALVDALLNQRKRGTWKWLSFNHDLGLEIARGYINDVFKKNYQISEVRDRANSLYKRFKLFKYMIHCTGVKWNSAYNLVDASEDKWTSLAIEYPMSRAYKPLGEPLYEELKLIFKQTDDDIEFAMPSFPLY